MQKKTMDIILIIICVMIILFTGAMIWVYLKVGDIPKVLCTCFFAACTGECGFMGLIKSTKIKYPEETQQNINEEQIK